MKKCDYIPQQVEYLRHIILNGTVVMDPAKISAFREWPLPINVKQLHSFLGFCNYQNRFNKTYSQITAPLTNLLLKDAVFVQGEQQQSSFEELVHALTSVPVIQMPRFDKPFAIHVNASDVAIGTVLT